jgi:hypothetical protein
MHVQARNMSHVDVSQLVVKAQVVAWRPYIQLFICWGFFVINDGLPMDLVKSQVLWCIIYKSKQTLKIYAPQVKLSIIR